jgi:hypothetical protein
VLDTDSGLGALAAAIPAGLTLQRDAYGLILAVMRDDAEVFSAILGRCDLPAKS